MGNYCDLLPDSPLPQGPLAVGVWADHSACQLAHTVLGWSCSPGRGNLHLGPGVSLHLVGSCGCGTRSPCGAAPHLGPRGLGGVEGWATGLPGPAHLHLQPEPCNLQLQQTYQNQQLRYWPRGASRRPQRALLGTMKQSVSKKIVKSKALIWSLQSIKQ